MSLVIKSIDADGTKWGVSLKGSNPAPHDYIGSLSEKDAYKLYAFLCGLDDQIEILEAAISAAHQEGCHQL